MWTYDVNAMGGKYFGLIKLSQIFLFKEKSFVVVYNIDQKQKLKNIETKQFWTKN